MGNWWEGRDVGEARVERAAAALGHVEARGVHRHRHEARPDGVEDEARRVVAGVLDPGRVTGAEEHVGEKAEARLRPAGHDDPLRVAGEAARCREIAGHLDTQPLGSARVAVAEVRGVAAHEVAVRGPAEGAREGVVGVGPAEGERTLRRMGRGARRCLAPHGDSRDVGGDEGARAHPGLGEAVAQQVLVGDDDGVAAGAELGGERAGGGEAQPGGEPPFQDRGPQSGMDAGRLAAARGVEPERQVQNLVLRPRSGRQIPLRIGPFGGHFGGGTVTPSTTREVMSVTDAPAPEAPTYPVDGVNRVKRRHDRGFYDQGTVHRLLDSAALCHVSYVIDGMPFCTPTLFWREGTTLYWHGSSASRMLRNLQEGEPACLTVTHFDSLVLARCGFNHSADYRSVMAFGHARLVSDPEEKDRALAMMVDRLFPGRTAQLRQSSRQEVKATSVISMEIERASAKVRAKGVADEDEDHPLPIYAERVPIHTVMGAPEPCPRLLPGVERPANLAGYREGRALEEALAEAYAEAYVPGAGA